ncbi:hypothetical protein [Serratia sp. M24T3]|uniref:hypothetical protein n=1 Tax=Serratia sp. M24T3 TaxID=932213 RepID=UPI00025BB655|nr:hypothetical protein [Serratia sp. M24T3]EIC83346.1 hypothetical protein SPM24T3_17085 [Serratia sp. M24T3]
MTTKHENFTAGEWIEAGDQIIGEDGFTLFRATENLLDGSQHHANIQRVVACVNAFAGIETFRIAGKDLGEILAGEVRLNKAEPTGDGGFSFSFSGGVIQLMANAFAEQFKDSGAINYLELIFQHHELGSLNVTMQRVEGLTPAQKLTQVEMELDKLKADYDAVAKIAGTAEILAELLKSVKFPKDMQISDAIKANISSDFMDGYNVRGIMDRKAVEAAGINVLSADPVAEFPPAGT